MLKQGEFINRKYRSLMIVNVISWTAYCLNFLVDAILGGNQLGETALTAVTIVSPLFLFVNVSGYLLSPGLGVLYGISNGEFDYERSYEYAGENVLTSFILGIITAAGLYLVKESFLNYYECTGELYSSASTYYNWLIAYALVYPLQTAVSYLLLADSDAVSIFIGFILNIGTNTILSYVLCNRIGIAGLGVATFISAFLCTIGFCFHFLRKTNSVHFRFYLSLSDMKQAFLLSLSRSTEYLFMALVDIVMNKAILSSCGTSFIPVYSIINLAFTCFEIIGSAFDSGEGMLASFLGEKNSCGINNVLKITVRSTAITSFVISALFFIFAPYMPALFGMEPGEIADVSIKTARIIAFGSVPFGLCYVAIEIYATLNKPWLSMLASFLLNLFCPLVLSIPLAYAFGFDGVSVGMMLSSYLVIVLFILIVKIFLGKKGFPFYLENYGEEVVAYDLEVENSSIILLRDQVLSELTNHGYDIPNIGNLIEELYLRILEKNGGRKVLSECALLFGDDRVRIIVRDNGKIFNFVDENSKVESLNAYVLSSLLEKTKNKSYVLTTSFNRNGFIFEK